MLRRLMPTCRELADQTASGGATSLGWLDRWRHRFHGWMCPPCRHYRRQIESIGEVARHSAKAHEPSAEQLRAMQGRCLEMLKGPATPATRAGDGAGARDSD